MHTYAYRFLRLGVGFTFINNIIMRPLKQLLPFSSWLMRFAVVFFVLISYWKTFTFFNFQSVMFYVAAIFVIFSVLLFIGGFFYKGSLTVISSLILILVTGYHAFLNLESRLDNNFAVYVVLGSIFVYFLTTGNNRNK